jgi:hypothetical protein
MVRIHRDRLQWVGVGRSYLYIPKRQSHLLTEWSECRPTRPHHASHLFQKLPYFPLDNFRTKVYCMDMYYKMMLRSSSMYKLIEEIIAIVKSSPRRYFAPIIGAIAAVRDEWNRVKRQA